MRSIPFFLRSSRFSAIPAALIAVSMLPCAFAKTEAAPTADTPIPAHEFPPAYMANLPKDYLDRVHQSQIRSFQRGDNFQLADILKQPPSTKNSIGWIRWSIGGLMLGQRVDEINEFIASPSFMWGKHDKFGFGFFGTEMLRCYGLFKADSPYMPGRLSAAAQANMEKGLWEVAKEYGELADARSNPWIQYGSANHNIMKMAGQLLAAQFLRKNPAYASQKYDDGTDMETMYKAWNQRMHDWLDARARTGFFTEWGSPSYEEDIANAVLNVRDFTDDPALRKKAEMFLNLYYAAVAEETIASSRGGAKMRTKNEHLYQPFMDRGYDLLFNSPGRTFEAQAENYRATSNYYPPAPIVNLARDMTSRGPYATLKRVNGVVIENGGGAGTDPTKNGRLISAEQSLPFYSYVTPHYVVGSNFYDARLSYASTASPWQGVIFDGAETARIGFYIKPASTEDWHVFDAYVSAQDRNVLVVQKWHPAPPNMPVHQPAYLQVYFSVTLDSVVEDESGWIFVQSGSSYAAVKVVAGGYSWNEKWEHADTPAKDRCTITLEQDSPVIVVTNDASDYNKDFNAFKKAVRAQPISYTDGTLKFATLTFSGTHGLPKINGETVNLAPARLFDSPFIRSDWNSGLLYIRKGDQAVKLDFTDPNNPAESLTTSKDSLSDYPPGVGGDTKPIVFRP